MIEKELKTLMDKYESARSLLNTSITTPFKNDNPMAVLITKHGRGVAMDVLESVISDLKKIVETES